VKIRIIALLFIYIFFQSERLTFPGNTMNKEHYVLSLSCTLKLLSLKNGKLIKSSILLDYKKVGNVLWPSYNKMNNDIYYQGESKSSEYSNIYRINLLKDHNQPKLFIEAGRCPSVSPDGNLLAYYIHPNQLWFLKLNNKVKIKYPNNIAIDYPITWISDHCFLYDNKEEQLVILDAYTGKEKQTGYYKIIPYALSPNGKKVLCGSYGVSQILLYDIETNTMEVLKKSRFLFFRGSLVWSDDGKNFLYSQQTFSNVIKLLEISDLFHYSLKNGKKTHLLKKRALFGGFSISEKEYQYFKKLSD
jgi:hypothetical protein